MLQNEAEKKSPLPKSGLLETIKDLLTIWDHYETTDIYQTWDETKLYCSCVVIKYDMKMTAVENLTCYY